MDISAVAIEDTEDEEQSGEKQIIKLRFTGTSAFMMNSDRGVNVFDPTVQQKRTLTSKKRKSEGDLAEIGRLEWEIAMYFDDKLGPFVPPVNIEASIRDGAKIERRGTDVERGLQVVDDRIKLIYVGPRQPDKMYAARKFVDIRSVKQQRARLMKTRPIFPEWSIDFELMFDTGVMNHADVIRFAELAGRYCGIGDARKLRMGRYTVEVL